MAPSDSGRRRWKSEKSAKDLKFFHLLLGSSKEKDLIRRGDTEEEPMVHFVRGTWKADKSTFVLSTPFSLNELKTKNNMKSNILSSLFISQLNFL